MPKSQAAAQSHAQQQRGKRPLREQDNRPARGPSKHAQTQAQAHTPASMLDAAVGEEDSGDRWASNDVAKAHRFYLKSIERYESCVSLCRTILHTGGGVSTGASTAASRDAGDVGEDEDESVEQVLEDAMSNHARLHLVIGSSAAVLPLDAAGWLFKAVGLYRALLSDPALPLARAVSPDGDGDGDAARRRADALFNLALSVTSLLGMLQEHDLDIAASNGAVPPQLETGAGRRECLATAAEALSGCRAIQEAALAVQDAADANPASGQGEDGAVVVRTTEQQLFDTLIAQVELATLAMQILPQRDDAAAAEEVAAAAPLLAEVEGAVQSAVSRLELSMQRIAADGGEANESSEVHRRAEQVIHELALARLEFQYEMSRYSLREWRNAVDEALLLPASELATASAEMLSLQADACVALAAAMMAHVRNSPSSPDADAMSTAAWQVLSSGAIPRLASACELTPREPRAWVARGDAELLRCHVRRDIATRSRPTLLKNAAAYYKRGLAEATAPTSIRVKFEADLKRCIVEAELQEEMPAMPVGLTQAEAKQIVRDARADGLLEGSWKLLS